jgi:ubiquitin-like protein Pup
MASRESGGQQRADRQSSDVDDVAEDTSASSDLKERQEALTDDIDSMLDEIDDVLEENAEDFVRAFVQKGGQ